MGRSTKILVSLWMCVLGTGYCSPAARASVLINELMAANSSFYADPQGEFDDWVELHNPGNTLVDAAGMYLTDDPAVPTKWKIPTNAANLTRIVAKGYLVIWLDNDTGDPGLHASFKLNADEDQIALFDKDGTTLLDLVAFKDQRTDISYGRFPAGSNSWRYMILPTPGALNTVAYEGTVADTKFSHDRGFYDEPFTVTITTKTPGAEIYYTMAGSAPLDIARSVPVGRLYTGPIAITTTTCLRAVAYKQLWIPTNIDTHTYIFLDHVITQATDPQTGAQVTPPGLPASWGSAPGNYQMDPDVVGQNGRDKFAGLYAGTIKDDLKSVPTVSLVMDKDDWFGSKGIYINQSQDGTERACSLEWIDPNGEGGFHINCAIAMQGGADKTNPASGTSLDRWKVFKLSMRPRFKPETDDGKPTGGPGRLDYRVFPDSPVRSFDTFVLDGVLTNAWNHSGQHQYGTYTQDQYVSDLHNAMGGQSPHGLYAHLYINGLYWGMYYVHERPDHAWAAQMFGGEKEEYDAIRHNAGIVINNGLGGTAPSNFNAMVGAAGRVAGDPGNVATYDALCRVLDIDNFITDLLAHWYATNWDWPEKNWYATHRSPEGPWRFHTWDAEHSMEYWNSQNVLGLSVSGIHDRLKANPEYRMHFADLVHRFFFNDGALTYPRTAEMYRARMAQIDRAIVGESARWGDTRSSTPHTRADWLSNQNNVLSRFIQPRSTTVLNWLRNAGLYPSVDAPVFYIGDAYQHGGHAGAGDQLSMRGGEGTTWYTLDGSDPRIPGTTPASTEAKLVAENAAKRVLVPTAQIPEAWKGGQAFDDSGWISGAGGVGFERSTGYETLIGIDVQGQMYNRNATCYVRIPFDTTVADLANLTGLTLRVRYDDGFVVYLNGQEVVRKNFTGNPTWNSAANTQNPDGSAVAFESFDVTAHADKLRLGQNLLAVQAMNSSTTSSDFLFSTELVSAKTPTAGGAPTGVSLTAVKYTTPITLSQSALVKARSLSNGVWSALNEAVFAVGPVAEGLRISEIMYHPADDPNAEYVELTNVGSQAINLNLVRFTNGIQYTFPSFQLPPAGYCLLVRDIPAFEAVYPPQADPPVGGPVLGQYAGSLNNGGERIELLDAAGQVIQSFEYKDDWFDLTDGMGFSLTARDSLSAEADGNPPAADWRPSAHAGGSPGEDDSGQVPELGSVVINELLTNPAAGGSDWIELHNTTAQPISIAGWYLSDDANDLTRYRIAAGTSIPAGGYVVFHQDQHFGNEDDPGCAEPFGLSKDGETLYLHSGSAGVLTGYSEQEKFDACEAGVSLGRWQKTTGSYNFVALKEPTPGAVNANPVVGPIVINEIMYHPADAEAAEYVELLNIGGAPVTLYDAATGAPWRFTDDPDDPSIELLLSSDPAITLAPGGYLVVAKDADLLRTKYAVPAGVRVLSWGAGRLADDTQKPQLSRPDGEDDGGTRLWLRVDRIVYSDGSRPQDFIGGVDPWPVEADGQGKSLSRIDPQAYGNDPANWRAANPSPGRMNP